MNVCISGWLPSYRCLNLLDFCVWCWLRSEFYKRKVDTRDKSLACVFCAASNFSHLTNLKHIYDDFFYSAFTFS